MLGFLHLGFSFESSLGIPDAYFCTIKEAAVTARRTPIVSQFSFFFNKDYRMRSDGKCEH